MVKVLVQWTQATPRDWVAIDVAPGRNPWRDLPAKPEPTGGEVIDDEPGWPFAVCVQGVTFSADHYAVWATGQGLFVATWNDDPPDTPVGERHAFVWRFRDPGPDPRFRGKVNTRQALEIYSEPGAVGKWVPAQTRTSDGPADRRPWQSFVRPDPALVRHGIWTTDELAEAHNAARSPVDWREWVA